MKKQNNTRIEQHRRARRRKDLKAKRREREHFSKMRASLEKKFGPQSESKPKEKKLPLTQEMRRKANRY